MNDNSGGVFIFLTILTAFAIGMAVGVRTNESIMREQAIDANCAYYDTKTAEFKWNTFSGNKQKE